MTDVPILLVKMSSLGDLVHTLPALTEAQAQGHRFRWVVEEAFVDLARCHPAVSDVVPVALRRWRRAPWRYLGDWRQFVQRLRSQPAERCLDAQGLIKSAVIARLGRSTRRFGYDRHSAREALAAWAYHRPIAVDRTQHAIERTRRLFAAALDYEAAEQAPRVHLRPGAITDAQPSAAARTVLVHGTSWPNKCWPTSYWVALVRELTRQGERVLVLSGSEQEWQHARSIVKASGAQGATAPAPAALQVAIDTIAHAELVIGVDSGLTHLAAVLGKATVALYGPTSAARTGARGPAARNLASSLYCAPCLQRRCSYRGTPVLEAGLPVQPPCFADVDVARVLDAVEDLRGETRRLHL